MTDNSSNIAHDDALKGILLVAAAVLMIALGNAVGKYMGEGMHPMELVFYRNVVVLVGLVAWFQLSGRWGQLKTKDFKGHIYRSIVGTCGVVFTFWSLSKLPLADATTLFYAAPLIVCALSVPMLGEKVGPFRSTAIIAGFAGITIVANPSGTGLPADGILLALCAALFHALTQLQLRKLGKSESPMTTVFYFMLFGTLITGASMPFVFTAPPDLPMVPIMLAFSFTAISQQVLKTYGYSMAPASLVTPINYTGLLWAAIIGFLVWGTVPQPSLYVGGAIVIAANLSIVWRESYLKKTGRLQR